MLGTVQDGLQIGALAQAKNGDYFQVNGDMVRVLNRSRVDFALDRITGVRRKAMATLLLPAAPSSPVVVIRKRRRLLPDTADAR